MDSMAVIRELNVQDWWIAVRIIEMYWSILEQASANEYDVVLSYH